ncbi:MAG: hypothetical protein GTN99_07455 [Candidatus Dadabacteria bacterium]|nr:hypothetical protein [Candidatus Dadabacteria bacterium]NIT14060.1 hypothetical protein [Candidatus Dadabacteria bacterium]
MKSILFVIAFSITLTSLNSCTKYDRRAARWDKLNIGNVAIVSPGTYYFNELSRLQNDGNKSGSLDFEGQNSISDSTINAVSGIGAVTYKSGGYYLKCVGEVAGEGLKESDPLLFSAIPIMGGLICLPIGMFIGLADVAGSAATSSLKQYEGKSNETRHIPVTKEDIEDISKNITVYLQKDLQNQLTHYANLYTPANFINVDELDNKQKNKLFDKNLIDGKNINYIIEIELAGISENDGSLVITSIYRLIKRPSNQLIHEVSMDYISNPRAMPVWVNNSAEALEESIKNAFSEFSRKIVNEFLVQVDKELKGQVVISE